MRSRTKVVVLVASLGLFVAAFAWLLTTKGPLAPVGVQLGTVVRGDLHPTIFGIGTVDARLAYAVGPVAPGRLLRVLVDQGDTVTAGQLLAEMDPIDLDRRVEAAQSAVARARAGLRAVNAQVSEANSRARLARTNRDRDLNLMKRNVISQQALDNSKSEAERAEAALAGARANVAVTQKDIERIEADAEAIALLRESLKLVSPADGVVVSRDAEPGTTVVGGQAVLRIVVPESLWVRARVDQSRAQGLKVGQASTITLRSAPNVAHPGHVARVEIQSDSVTEERVVAVAFEPLPAPLYLGELAEVTIQVPGESGVLIAPSAAITRADGHIGVWQVVEGRAHFTPVEIGDQGQAGVTRIRSGLAEGSSIIVYSSAQLHEGARVREQAVATP